MTTENQVLSNVSTNDTSTVERFSLRLGQYSISEYDIFTKYMFSVINYPKDHSDTTTRITSYFIGLAEWLNTDSLIDIHKIIEESAQKTSGSKTIENIIDLSGNNLRNQNFGLSSIAYIGISLVETLVNSVQTDSTRKRLMLLLKKFRQEKAWSDQLYTAKKDENNFFVKMDYYYFRFAVERMHIGLKLLNRYGYKKTYLDPSAAESPLTRVSANRTKNKDRNALVSHVIADDGKPITFTRDDELGIITGIEGQITADVVYKYSWSQLDSDSFSHKPGQTTRLRSIPQLLNLSYDFTKSLALNSSDETKNVYKSIDPSIMQNFYTRPEKDSDNRIPSELVKQIEDLLESEYVPFYIHDVRTNEILSFHAFIDSVSDSFNPEYTSASGFGRIDDVKSYVKTTRNINLGFTIAATSETDHDQMWYQINKLVTLVYPQWSEGHLANVNDEENIFMYPFTQVPTASPLVRIRLGDVIKNNYSRSSLSRIFGVENLMNDKKDGKFTFVEDIDIVTKPYLSSSDAFIEYELLPGLYTVATTGTEFFPAKKSYYEVRNPISVIHDEKSEIEKDKITVKKSGGTNKKIDLSSKSVVVKIKGKDINLLVDSSKIIEKHFLAAHGEEKDKISNARKKAKSLMNPMSADAKKFNNPITASYESGMSRGIAGFITQLDINYNESTWETSRIGSKAPMLVKITLNFSPIHDIPLGIDHRGMMRAPAYNVGRVNNTFFGDSHDSESIGDGIDHAQTVYNGLHSKMNTGNKSKDAEAEFLNNLTYSKGKS